MADSGANAENLVGLDAARRERARATLEMAPGVGRRLVEIEGQLATLVAELALARVQRREEIVAVRRTSLREVPDQPAVPSVSEIAAEVAREVRAALGADIRAALREVVAETRAQATPTSAVVRTEALLTARPQSADALVADLLASIAPPAAPIFVPPASTPMRESSREAGTPVAPVISSASVFSTSAAASAGGGVEAPRGVRELQLVVAPLFSFAQMLDVEMGIRSFTSVTAMRLSDFRNGVATFAVSVGEAISPGEFGAALQMVEALHLRLERNTPNSVELRVEDQPPAS